MNQQGKILAVVGNRTVTEKDVEEMLAGLGQRAQQYNNPQGRQIILDQIVNKELVLMDAKKNLMEHNAEFKAELEKLKNELLANFYVEQILKDVKVSESSLQQYYDEHPEEFMGEDTVSAKHILVEEEAKALDLMEKIQKGEMTFEEAAKAFSTCPSGQNGGDLGEFGRGQMVAEFDKACFEMEVGELRGPIKTQFGYHLIRLEKKTPATAISFGEARTNIQRKLLGEAQQKAYQSKMNQLRILYPVDFSGML